MSEKRPTFSEAEAEIVRLLIAKQKSAVAKYPLTFGLAATFGFVCVLYGFNKFVNSVEFFVNNPGVVFAIGVVILIITGAAYKKLR